MEPAAHAARATAVAPTPLTSEQASAVSAEGNVLVMAGAGTGKTRTLVDRCLDRVCRPVDPVPLDAILMVTFTEAAAAEMRERLRRALEERAAAAPADAWLAEQVALVDLARISTLHGFCLQLVREHFHELGLDPELAVLPDDQARLLADDTLEAVLQRHYAGDAATDLAVQQLVLEFCRGWDVPLRRLVFRLHHYAQTLQDPDGWLRRQLDALRLDRPTHWEGWLVEAFVAWRAEWLPVLAAQPADHPNARQAAQALDSAPPQPSRAQMASALAGVMAADAIWPPRAKTRLRAPLKGLFDEAAFLLSLARNPDTAASRDTGERVRGSTQRSDETLAGAGGRDPLVEDWIWCRAPVGSLLQLTVEFGRAFSQAKRELGALDFHDLEQFALRVLWDPIRGAPTAQAQGWRDRLRLVFVDEYQDINEAQDTLLRALGGEGATSNRFLVGDVKQSIYRFRLADPRIFQRYAAAWGQPGADGRVLRLTGNFRSRPGLLDFVNRLFHVLMRPEIGGVAYTAEQWLRPGTGVAESDLAAADGGADPPPIELQLLRSTREAAGDDADDRSIAAKEAALVADRLAALRRDGLRVRDRAGGAGRPVRWGDMAILLRAPRGKAEVYAREFAARGVPLQIERGGFCDRPEIVDLVSLLQLLDNPLQDLPLLTVLRSPLVGLTPDELAVIRTGRRAGGFWSALQRFHREADPRTARVRGPDSGVAAVAAGIQREAWAKVDGFLAAFGRWREQARVVPLSECLETVLRDTAYEAWLGAEPQPAERLANVGRLLDLTRQFDPLQRQGLPRFLHFHDARREAEIELEPAVVTPPDAVRLLSVHRSKGLEFPVVVVADLAHRFNLEDLRAPLLLDEVFGVCARVQPPGRHRRYPSLPYWAARRRQRLEALGEELRLLYVALTRARDYLVLVGTATPATLAKRWSPAPGWSTPRGLQAANAWLDWLGPWLTTETRHTDWTRSGSHPLLHWSVVESSDPRLGAATAPAETENAGRAADAAALTRLGQRLAYRYPARSATREAAKASVSVLRRRVREELDDEAEPLFRGVARGSPAFRAASPGQPLAATAVGIAHHLVMETLPLGAPLDRTTIAAHLDRLHQDGWLHSDEVAAVNTDALAAFWSGPIGRRLRERHAEVQRELPFTARLEPADLVRLGLRSVASLPSDEFVVVQGIADLVMLGAEEIWLLDFKTDQVSAKALPERARGYAPQLQLYGLALERIYRRPVRHRWLHFLARNHTVDVPA